MPLQIPTKQNDQNTSNQLQQLQTTINMPIVSPTSVLSPLHEAQHEDSDNNRNLPQKEVSQQQEEEQEPSSTMSGALRFRAVEQLDHLLQFERDGASRFGRIESDADVGDII